MVAVNVTLSPGVDGLAEDTNVIDVGAAETICAAACESLPRNAASPPYDAVTECEPVRSVTGSAAIPLASSATVPRTSLPSLNVMIPVGLPASALTAAVNVTLCPKVDGFDELVSA